MFTTLRRVAVVAVLVIASGSIFAPSAGAITATATSPADGSTVNAPATVRVVHDVPLDPLGSSITLRDSSSALVGGSTSLATTTAPNDTIIFTPTSPLTQAASPYSATAIGKALGSALTVTTNFSFSVDSTAPAKPIIRSVTNPVNASNQTTVSVIGTAEPGSTVSVYIQDAATNAVLKQVTAAPDSSYLAILNLTDLNDGALSVAVSATDTAFNVSDVEYDATFKDTVAPAIPGVTIVDDPITLANQATVTISGTSSAESGLTIQVSVDDTSASTPARTGSATIADGGAWTLDLDLTSLHQGTITASATATDASGNPSGKGTDTATKETGAPVLVSTTPADGSTVASPATITATYDEPLDTAGSTISVVGSSAAVTGTTTFADGNQTIVFTPAVPLTDAGSPYTVTSTAKDLLGNVESPPSQFSFSVAPPPTISIADGTPVVEGATANLTVTLSAVSGQTVTVHAATSDGTATSADYTAITDVTVTFAPGETTKQVSVVTLGDSAAEANETFVVTLVIPTNATILDGSGTGTILDDDAAGTYTPVTPARLLDTRSGLGRPGTTKVASGQTVTLDVTGFGAVPTTGVAAVVLNVTVADPEGGGFVTVTPSGGSSTSNVNFAPGEVVANLVMVPIGTDGNVRLFTNRTTHLVADVFGWFASDTAVTPGSHFTSVTPARLLDTRTGQGVPGGSSAPLAAGTTRVLDVTGVGTVPSSGVTAVILNVTVTQPTTPSFLSVTPTGGTSTSNINFVGGETVAGLVVVPVGPDGSVRYALGAGSTHVVADVLGWFATPGTITGSVLTTVAPSRLLDTRNEPSGKVGPSQSVRIAGRGGVPATGARSAVLNLTVTEPTAPSFLTATPNGATSTSNLNFIAGQTVANSAVVPINPDGDIVIRNYSGFFHLIVDVLAWFSTPAP